MEVIMGALRYLSVLGNNIVIMKENIDQLSSPLNKVKTIKYIDIKYIDIINGLGIECRG